MENVFFSSGTALVRIVVIAVLAYVALVLVLRISGKRTLSKLNAFDFVVTVALGSALATSILSKQTPLLESLLAIILLVSLQALVSWLSMRFGLFDRAVKAKPTVLLLHGKLLQEAARKERIAKDEVLAAARAAGFASLELISAIVLETDGSLSVIHRGDVREGSAMPVDRA